MLPAADALYINQIMVYDFHNPVPDDVHPLHPQHLILCLKLFGDILTGCHLLYQLKNHIFCLIVQISKIIVQFAGDL